MKENENYYIDKIGNEWNKEYFTREEAETQSKEMIYCKCNGHICLLNNEATND